MARDDLQPDLPGRIGRPALRALVAAGYTRLDQFSGATESDLLSLHGMGPKAIRLLREELNARGQSFRAPKEAP